jgi:hypothetical protein
MRKLKARKPKSIDLLMFWGLIGTIGVAHSLLLTGGTPWETTTWFYIGIWLSSMMILLWCWVRYGQVHQFDYDEGLNQNKLFYILGGLVAVIFVASALVQSFTKSSIWVPRPQQTLSVGGLGLSSLVNDIYYQLGLVCNAEETMVLAAGQVIRRRLAGSFPLRRAWAGAGLAVVVPRAGWAVLHAYVSYTGAMMPILVTSAFVSGLIISYAAYNEKVRSLLVAILIHFLFNASVIFADSLGLM